MSARLTPALLRDQLLRLGLAPDAVDLEWTADITLKTEQVILAVLSQSDAASASPLFQPERQPGNRDGG